jgi:hypothetical protein
MKYNELRERIAPHVGHDIEIVVYGSKNVAIECNSCNEVIIDCDTEDERDAEELDTERPGYCDHCGSKSTHWIEKEQ